MGCCQANSKPAKDKKPNTQTTETLNTNQNERTARYQTQQGAEPTMTDLPKKIESAAPVLQIQQSEIDQQQHQKPIPAPPIEEQLPPIIPMPREGVFENPYPSLLDQVEINQGEFSVIKTKSIAYLIEEIKKDEQMILSDIQLVTESCKRKEGGETLRYLLEIKHKEFTNLQALIKILRITIQYREQAHFEKKEQLLRSVLVLDQNGIPSTYFGIQEDYQELRRYLNIID